MLPSFLGRDLLVQYPTTVVAVVFLILVWRNTHDLLKIAVEGGNILISDPQSNLRHGIIGGIEQFIGFLDAYHRQIFDWRHGDILRYSLNLRRSCASLKEQMDARSSPEIGFI